MRRAPAWFLRFDREALPWRFGAPLALALITVSIVGVSALNHFNRLADEADQASAAALELRLLSAQSLALVITQDDATKAILLDPDRLSDESMRKIEAFDANDALLTRADSLSTSSTVRGLVQRARSLEADSLRPVDTEMLEASGGGDAETARTLYATRYLPVRERFALVLDSLRDAVAEESVRATGAAMAARRVATATTVLAFIGCLVSVLLVAFRLTRAVSQSLRAVEDMARTLSAGPIEAVSAASRALARGDVSSPMLATDSVGGSPTGRRRFTCRELDRLSEAMADMSGRALDSVAQFENARVALAGLVDAANEKIDAAMDGRSSDALETRRHFTGSYGALLTSLEELQRTLERPLTETRAVLEAAAHGDLTSRLHGTYRGSHAALRDGVHRALDAMVDSLRDVREESSEVGRQSHVVRDVSEALRRGVATQRSETETLGRELRGLNSAAQANASTTHAASDALSAVAAAAEGAREKASAMTDVNRRMESAARATATALAAIEAIAFKTRLLSLNAAVEAARAGDSGRGFAVVAEEVRMLADQCAETAHRSSELISQSTATAAEGAGTAHEVGESIGRLVQHVDSARTLVQDMSQRSDAQAESVRLGLTALERLETVARSTTSDAGRCAEVGESLEARATALHEAVQRFQLERDLPRSSKPVRTLVAA